MSDEAMEVERMLQRWLKTYGGVGGDANQMASWFRDYFDKAFQWALSHPRAVETTKGGVLDSALSHLRLGPGSKVEFMAGLCRGIGSNMNTEVRNQFYNDMARWAGVTASPGMGASRVHRRRGEGHPLCCGLRCRWYPRQPNSRTSCTSRHLTFRQALHGNGGTAPCLPAHQDMPSPSPIHNDGKHFQKTVNQG